MSYCNFYRLLDDDDVINCYHDSNRHKVFIDTCKICFPNKSNGAAKCNFLFASCKVEVCCTVA